MVLQKLLDQIVEHKAHEDAKNKANLERADEILRQGVENFNTATRITAGIAFRSNRCVLDQEVRDRVYAINSERERKKKEVAERKEKAEETIARKVAAIKMKGGPEKWSTDEMRTMVSWFKRPGDSKIPGTKSALYQRYLLTCTRHEDERNRLKEGEVAVVVENEVVDGNH